MVSKKRIIMLIDDDIDFLEMNKHILEAKGYRILCCSDAREALERMAIERPDMVVADLMMETLDSGFSFSRKIKEDPGLANIPVIIVTAIGSKRGFDFSPHTPDELEAMHADAYFDKPIAPKTLIAKIEELLESPVEEDST